MGMRPATFYAPIFESDDINQVELSFEMLKAMLEGLCKANLAYLRRVPTVPIYQSGVVYQAENNTEDWLTVPYILHYKAGDCEDLAGWRSAELQAQGIPAKPDILARKINGIWRAHAIVRLPNGTIEDPSKILGMKGG